MSCVAPLGVLVFLKSPHGTRQPFLLCVRVSGDVWVCHPGTLSDGGSLCSDNPFDIKDLAVRDVVADRFERDALPCRRIAPHTKVNLVEAAAANPHHWSQARAVALWKAEEVRAESGHLDVEKASTGFERNPFKWNSDGRFSHTEICFLRSCASQ